MTETPGSAAATSDVEPPSSPVRVDANENQSFSHAVTEDEDTRMADGSPEPSRHAGGRGKRGTKANEPPPVVGKIKHLKKDDGEPLWRKDIQYDWLRSIFDNEKAVFTNSYEPDKKQCFADLYIDTMARSSKTSKVLRDKLLSDREAAKNMAMVCLLVNIGRMNTTLNFFPEMRAQLRTYHAIPSLQANQDPHAYKQLQDAPRLKSILKGGAEDRQEPNSLDKIKKLDVPRTNPVNLLFVICQSAAKVAELHFPNGQEFNDLVMKTKFHSWSRADAFLWIMWFYLESDFTEEGCDENPFGPGVDYGVSVANQGVPRLQPMTPEEEARENVDTEAEMAFGREKQEMRRKIIEADEKSYVDSYVKRSSRAVGGAAGGLAGRDYREDGPAILPRIRPSKHESDMDSTRSTPPPRALARGLGGSSRRGGASLKYQILDASSPAPASHGGRDSGATGGDGIVTRKPRPPTAHQLAVERNRNQRVEYILDRGLRRQHHKARKGRKLESSVYRAAQRIRHMQDPFEDSDSDNPRAVVVGSGSQPSSFVAGETTNRSLTAPVFRERGFGGLSLLADEEDDFGEEVTSYAAAFRRATRRLKRWAEAAGPLGVVPAVKRRKVVVEQLDDEGRDDEYDDEEELEEDDVEPEPEPEVQRGGARKRKSAAGGSRSIKVKVGGGRKDGERSAAAIRARARRLALKEEAAVAGDVTMDDPDEGEDGEKMDAAEDDDEELDQVDRRLLGMEDDDSEI